MIIRNRGQAVPYGIEPLDPVDVHCRADHLNGDHILYCKILWCKGQPDHGGSCSTHRYRRVHDLLLRAGQWSGTGLHCGNCMAAGLAETVHDRLAQGLCDCGLYLDRDLRCRVVPAGAVNTARALLGTPVSSLHDLPTPAPRTLRPGTTHNQQQFPERDQHHEPDLPLRSPPARHRQHRECHRVRGVPESRGTRQIYPGPVRRAEPGVPVHARTVRHERAGAHRIG